MGTGDRAARHSHRSRRRERRKRVAAPLLHRGVAALSRCPPCAARRPVGTSGRRSRARSDRARGNRTRRARRGGPARAMEPRRAGPSRLHRRRVPQRARTRTLLLAGGSRAGQPLFASGTRPGGRRAAGSLSRGGPGPKAQQSAGVQSMKSLLLFAAAASLAAAGPDWARLEHEGVAFLQNYIQLQSVNPPANTVAAAELVKGLLESHGIVATLYRSGPQGQTNLVARLPGCDRGIIWMMQQPGVIDPEYVQFKLEDMIFCDSRRAGGSVAVLLAFLVFGLLPAGAGLTPEQWREDVRFLAQELPKRHANAFHSISRAQFERRIQELLNSAGTAADLQMRAGIVRLVAAIGDTETGAWLGSGPSLPFRVWEFSEGVYFTAAPAEYRETIGARILAVNGVPVDKVRQLLLPLASAPDDVTRRTALDWWLRNVEALRATGIAASADEVEFTVERDGRQFRARITPSAGNGEPPLERTPPGITVAPPLYLRNRRARYWFEYFKEERTLYLQYNACEDDPREPFAAFVKRLVQRARQERPERFVIDLRHNGGGSTRVTAPLLKALKREDVLRRKGGLYALGGRNTASAALILAIQLRGEHHAVLAGEALGERPNGYGDWRTFDLPHSKLRVRYSTKYFRLVDGDPAARSEERRVG